ncbi:MAG: hypothetical protein ISN64_02265 [Rickettsia sp.]|nr:hypothetical protein [Rickettsia sp.]
MITILASMIGFLGSIIPAIIKYLKDTNDKKHELNILETKIKIKNQNNSQFIDEQKLAAELLEVIMLHSNFTIKTPWLDALNTSVRPILAYSFFIAYTSIKYIQYKHFSIHINFLDALENLWNVEDQAIFASIISFYFGQRAFKNTWINKYSNFNVTKKHQNNLD